MARNRYQRVTGMQDILPEDKIYWRHILEQAQLTLDRFGFEQIDTPILETAHLFQRGVGEGTDIVEKEMYIFEDRDGDTLCLRPEFTAGVMRAFIENGLHTLPTPLKLWTTGPLFRHERNQLGRYRQHSQLNLEVLGEDDAAIDAELINVAWTLFGALGITGLKLFVHSTGDSECRPRYVEALVNYFTRYQADLPADDKRRLAQNPLRILDTKEEKTQALFNEVPRLQDYLNPDCAEHFEKLQSYLTALNIPFQVDYKLVRGFDYYTKTVFEIKAPGSLGSQDTVCGGGRYNGLIEELGGRPTPGVGFGSGLERLVLTMRDQNVAVPGQPQPLAYVAYLGEPAKLVALQLTNSLRQSGHVALMGSGDRSLKSQMKSADRASARFALIIGADEVEQGQALVRNLSNRQQEHIPLTDVARYLSQP
jgi:histidyl-tRNA synthetase